MVFRTARQPRHLVLLIVATLFAAGFVALGVWQYQVAQQDARQQALEKAAARPVVPMADLIRPHAQFPGDAGLRRVTTSGRYDGAKSFLVPGRLLQGHTGYWVLTPLVVDGTGARIPVLRGFVTTPGAPPPAPSGHIRLVAALAPAESPREPENLPAGQREAVDVGALLNEWGGDVYNAFLFVDRQQPAETSSALQHVPPPRPDADGFDWRNLGYAIQWFLFAMFAYYLWWRMVREDHRDQQVLAAQRAPEDTDPASQMENQHV